MSKAFLWAVGKRVPAALYDVVIVTGITLLPLLMGRLVLIIPSSPHYSKEPYWAFFTNGQMAFYSIGTIAAILILLFDENISKAFRKFLLLSGVSALFFLAVLVGIDPTLKATSFSFVGKMTLFIYLTALATRVLVDAIRSVDEKEARDAGAASTSKTTKGLKERKGVTDA